jgi:hypothetical protein
MFAECKLVGTAALAAADRAIAVAADKAIG